MRKMDTEWVEMRLAPLFATQDRHNEQINAADRAVTDLESKVRDLERDRDAHALTVEQAANSVRSLLQQANRKLRQTGALPPEEPDLTDPPPESHGVEVLTSPRMAGGRRVI